MAGEFDGLELLCDPIVRIAAWPIETLRPFVAPELDCAADSVLDLHDMVAQARTALCERIFQTVSAPMPRKTRWRLLEVRRLLFGTMAPPGADVLDELEGHPGLRDELRRHIEDRVRLRDALTCFEETWQNTLEEQRRHLHVLAAEERFLKALAIGSPAVYDAWHKVTRSGSVRNTARARRLDYALWRLLVRACTRPTPHGLWAGVQHAAAPAGATRYRVGVRLAGFADILSAGLTRERSGDTALRRDPSLHRDGADWTWLGIGSEGTTWARVPQNPILDRILAEFPPGGELSVARLANAVADGDDALRANIQALTWRLVDRGLLQHATALPGAAPDVWSALDDVTARLAGEFGSRWSDAIARLRANCSELESGIDAWPADRIHSEITACNQIIDELRRSVGLFGSSEDSVTVDLEFAHDLRAFRGGRYHRAALEAIVAALSVAAVSGCNESYRRATAEELAAILGTRVPMPISQSARIWDELVRRRRAAHYRQTVVDPFDTYPGLFDRRFGPSPELALDVQAGCDAWEDWLSGSWRHPVFLGTRDPVLPAFGHGSAVLVDDGGGGLAFGSSRPQPGAFHGRHSPPAQTAARLRAALSETVEVVGRDCTEPAVATRPALTGYRIDLTAGDETSGEHWRVTATPDRRIWLVPNDSPDLRLAPVYNSAAAIGWLDPVSSLLFGAAMTHGWELHSVGCPVHPAERDVWRHHPQIRIAGTDCAAQVSARRWTVDGPAAARTAASEGASRFLEWRRATRHIGLPDIVYVRGTDPEQPPRACVVSSALSVDSLFQRVPDSAPSGELILTTVETGGGQGFQVSDDRGTFAWEVAQPWRVVGHDRTEAVHDEAVAAHDEPVDIDALLSQMDSYRRAGDNWLQVDAALAGESAWRTLAGLVDILERDGAVDSWWFIHKPPGVRLRLRSNNIAGLSERLDRVRADLPGLRIQALGHYEPELATFGGAHGLGLAHRHFAADSRLGLTWRTGSGFPADLSRTVGLFTAHALFSRIAEDRAEMRDLWQRLQLALRDVPVSGVAADAGLETAIGRCLAGEAAVPTDPDADAVVARATRWGRRIGDAAADLRRIEGLAVRGWATSLVVFHWNRWALTPAATRPLVDAVIERLPGP